MTVASTEYGNPDQLVYKALDVYTIFFFAHFSLHQ